MPIILEETSRTFSEYLLIPNHSGKQCVANAVSLQTPLVKFKKGETSKIMLNIPFSSAIMQSVSGEKLAIALAGEGGISFIFASQPIESQCEMVRNVKNYKAGFVVSDSNVCENTTLKEILELTQKTGHSTVVVTSNGSYNGKLLGIITNHDYIEGRTPPNTKASEIMTTLEKLVTAKEGVTLEQADEIILKNKVPVLPVVDEGGRLCALAFRKDIVSKKENPNELIDSKKRLIVGAGVNTHDYEQRIPALVEAGADVLCIDSSDGHTDWQKDVIEFVRKKYGDNVKIGAGNVVDEEGFLFLAQAGADFVKVGIGGGSICITREQKGIGRGQATSVLEVCRARDNYFKKTGIYVPVCSDGGIVQDYHITLALAMGADFVMLGRYFARFDESPTKKIILNGNYVKEYWGEGSNRAKNWQRYEDSGKKSELTFEEGVDSYVPYAGTLKDNVSIACKKIKSTMCNLGSLSIPELYKKAKITVVSQASIKEGSAHDVVLKDNLRS